jgi:restriction system protein
LAFRGATPLFSEDLMAKKSNIFEDVVSIISKMPWWVGITMAVASYFWLNSVATNPVSPMSSSGSYAPNNIAEMMFHEMAKLLQYLIPGSMVVGSAISLYNSIKNKKLYDQVAHKKIVSSLLSIDWQDFELLVSEVFKRKGFKTITNEGKGPDGGIDIVLLKGSDKYFVQCKQWKANKVGVQIVRELYGVIASTDVSGGFVVTSGVFTKEARKFASGISIELIDGKELLRIIDLNEISTNQDQNCTIKHAKERPVCPTCNLEMIKRVAKKGINVGNEFWGCSNFPKCKMIKEL